MAKKSFEDLSIDLMFKFSKVLNIVKLEMALQEMEKKGLITKEYHKNFGDDLLEAYLKKLEK